MKTSTTMTLSLPIESKGESKYFVYHCPALDLWSLGKTKEEAERDLIQSLQFLLERCSKYDSIDKVLSDCGYKNVSLEIMN